MSETVTITKEQWDRKWLGFEYDPKKYSDIYTNTSWDNLCKIGTVHEKPEEDTGDVFMTTGKPNMSIKDEQETDYKYMSNEKFADHVKNFDMSLKDKFLSELEHRLQAHQVPEKPLSEVELLDAYLQLEQDTNGSVIERTNLRQEILARMNNDLKLPDTGDDEKKALENFKGICKDFVEMEKLNPIKTDTVGD